MAAEVKHNFIVLLLLFLFTNVKHVAAYYCGWDLCGPGQYCCGEDLCCEYIYSSWYIWAIVVFVIIAVSACGGFMKFCYYRTDPLFIHAQYVTLSNKESNYPDPPSDVEAGAPYPVYPALGGLSYGKPCGPPPPYSTLASNKKAYYDKGDKD